MIKNEDVHTVGTIQENIDLGDTAPGTDIQDEISCNIRLRRREALKARAQSLVIAKKTDNQPNGSKLEFQGLAEQGSVVKYTCSWYSSYHQSSYQSCFYYSGYASWHGSYSYVP